MADSYSDGGSRPLVQWSFLQYKKGASSTAPAQSFLHSATQIGSKLLLFGGCDVKGDPLSQLFIYDTNSYQWSVPGDGSQFQEDHPGKRYGHSAVLVSMHPPKVMIYGGMVGGGTYDFGDAPETADGPDDFGSSGDSGRGESSGGALERTFMSTRRKGKKASLVEEQVKLIICSMIFSL